MRCVRQALLLLIIATPIACRSSKTGELRDVNELERLLQNQDPAVRAKAALDLSKHGAAAAKAVPPLIEALKRFASVRLEDRDCAAAED